MGNSLLSLGLKRIKKKHGDISIKEWSARSGVSESSIARFLSTSLNIPNFPAICAMLKCLGESIDDFYDSLDEHINEPSEALKLDAVPVAVIGDIPVDLPESKAEIQERIIVQTEAMQAQTAALKAKQTEIEMLELRLELADRLMDEKDRTIAALEETNRRRLEALKALCSAQ